VRRFSCQKKRTLQSNEQYFFVYASFASLLFSQVHLAVGMMATLKACKETHRWFEQILWAVCRRDSSPTTIATSN
jgi:hypothetical protein